MQPWEQLDRATGPEGEQFELVRRGDEYVIRANGRVLMSSRQHHSEEVMAEVLEPNGSGRILIGGLGLGFTLRAVLDRVGPEASVEVAELSEAVARWNQGVLGPLAGSPLKDPRVRLLIGDVATVLQQDRHGYEAILLDVDNGPEALTSPGNVRLYSDAGLAVLKRAMKPHGVAVFWSAAEDPAFRRRLEALFRVEIRTVRAQGVTHRLFVARPAVSRTAASGRRPGNAGSRRGG